MMMHNHTKFGCIQFSGLEDIFQTKVRRTTLVHWYTPLNFIRGVYNNKHILHWYITNTMYQSHNNNQSDSSVLKQVIAKNDKK